MKASRSRLSGLSLEEKALLLEKLRERKRAAGEGAGIGRRDPAGDPPLLSFAQQRLWFLDRLVPGDPAYNIALPVWLEGPLDQTGLRRALDGVVIRHEALRTTFGAVGSTPVQVIVPTGHCELPRIDLSALGARARKEAELLASEESHLPFDLGAGPLLRAALVRLQPELHLLCLTLHHIVSDGWSMDVLIRDVAALYRGEELPPLPIQYADFAVWQRQWLSGEVLEKQLAYWRERLAGLPAALDLPTDRPRPPVRGTAGDFVPLDLDTETGERVRELARSLGATPFMVLLAAWCALLQRITGQDDLCVGSPVANRGRPETDPLIGFFVNTLVLRADLAGDPTFRELLDRLRPRAIEAFSHQDLPFERLVEELRPERDPSRSPLVQVSLTVQTGSGEPPRLGPVRVVPLPPEGGAVRFDLTLTFRSGFAGALLYATALFDRTTAQRLANGFVRLAAAAIAAPDRLLSELPLLSEEESTQLLREHNDTRAARPAPTLLERFAAWAERTPGALAVDAGERGLTYAELAERTARLAAHLRSLGVGPEVLVGLQADRSPELVLGILAIWEAGGAYLPLDPTLPAERRAWMLADSGARVLLAEPGTYLPLFQGTVIGLGEALLGAPASRRLSFDPDILAYAIYTSGSTGRPKGVLVPHRGLANLAAEMHRFAAGPGSRVLLFASPGFDASLLDLALAFSSGATLSVAPGRELPGLGRLLRERRITHLHLPPSALAALGDEGPPPGLQCVILGGEPVPEPLAARWGAGRRLFNDYGPTESTVFVTVDEGLTIGRPIANVEVHLLDRDLRPVPLGVPGEVCLAGAGLARGYLNLPALTAERFVPCSGGERLYRTGDLARRLPDGRIDFLGRIDHQVKVRGFRIEPGEVEAALRRHPAVEEAVVVPLGEGTERALAAWVVPSGTVSSEELRAFLRETLPAYLVPDSIGLLDRLPLTPNGKVDRRALARRAPEVRPAAAGAPPRTELERTLAAAWAELLGLERVGLDESFFDLGGHSLLLARLQGVLYERLGREVPLLALFEHPTVGALARYLETSQETSASVEVAAGNRDREQRRREALERQRRRLAGRRAS
ncbi:MAG TPA: amino acid adenylation domain-containing protein [Thermoanaerobaculia bacterium]|nr:amino acid adenylation domain-containing protein [Thermoanaerobaculia bacterium]